MTVLRPDLVQSKRGVVSIDSSTLTENRNNPWSRGADTEEIVLIRWGMPPPPTMRGPPVTNIRNTSSPDWRGWLKPENPSLVPANSFAEYAPEQWHRFDSWR